MGVYGVSLANRRTIFLAVLSLIASMLAIGFNAPAAMADSEEVSFVDAGPTNVAEEVGTVNLDIAVTSTGTFVGPVTFDITTGGSATLGDDYSLSATDFTFGAAGTQTLVVTINDNSVYEGDEDIVLGFTNILPGTASAGANPTHTINISDSVDQPSISIDSPVAVTEGTPITFTVTRSGPSDVPITFDATTTPDTASGSDFSNAFTNPLTIPAGATDFVQFVVNTIADGIYEGAQESFDVSIGSIVGATGGTTTSVGLINDADGTPTLTITSPTASEDAASVTFIVGRSGPDTVSDILFSYTTVAGTATAGEDYTTTTDTDGVIPAAGGTFNIIVPLLGDDIDEGADEQFEMSISVTSGNANDPAANGTATLTENDSAGVTISKTGVTVSEAGGTDTYTVVLDSEPVDDVDIELTPAGTEATAESTLTSLTTLTFTAANWDIPQSVTVIADDDDVDDDGVGETINHIASSTGDPNYDVGNVGSVDVTITDDDTAGVTITPTSVSATEGGSDGTYTVELDSEPIADVDITLTEVGGTEFDATPTPLTFTDADWDVPQTVTVTAVDDAIADGNTLGSITHSESSTDPNYDAGSLTIDSVDVTVIDDETPNISVTGSPLAVEGGADGTYTVELTAEPTGTVSVALTITMGAGEFTILTASPLTFDAGDFDVPQTVTVEAVDDDIIDGAQMGEINHVATGGGYDGVDPLTVDVTVDDDDEAGVTVVESDGTTEVAEGGATDTYTVVLDAEPAANVTVTATPDAQVEVTPLTRTFTPANWDVPQTFTVAGKSDGIDELPVHTGSVQHTTTSSDSDFDAIAVDTVIADVTDVDELLVTIEGPTFGAPGKASSFMAMVNAGGTGTITYDWTVFFQGNVIADGDEAAFQFTPTEGGSYIISAIVGDTQGQNPAVFINFTALGDISTSVFVDDIIWLAEEGITRGCNPPANDEFCPEKTVTRGQMAAFLVRFLGLTAIDPTIEFTDTGGSIFEQDILKLATAGITRGCNAERTEFCPDRGVTRGQMAAFLVRAFVLTDNGGGDLFDDDDLSIFEDDIDKLATAGITRGCNPPDNTNFCPDRTVTRGQMAAFLRRAEPLI